MNSFHTVTHDPRSVDLEDFLLLSSFSGEVPVKREEKKGEEEERREEREEESILMIIRKKNIEIIIQKFHHFIP